TEQRLERPGAVRLARNGPRRLREGARAVTAAQRFDARLGEPLCAPRARTVSRQQTRHLPGSRHQLSHVASVSALSAPGCAPADRRRLAARGEAAGSGVGGIWLVQPPYHVVMLTKTREGMPPSGRDVPRKR